MKGYPSGSSTRRSASARVSGRAQPWRVKRWWREPLLRFLVAGLALCPIRVSMWSAARSREPEDGLRQRDVTWTEQLKMQTSPFHHLRKETVMLRRASLFTLVPVLLTVGLASAQEWNRRYPRPRPGIEQTVFNLLN